MAHLARQSIGGVRPSKVAAGRPKASAHVAPVPLRTLRCHHYVPALRRSAGGRRRRALGHGCAIDRLRCLGDTSLGSDHRPPRDPTSLPLDVVMCLVSACKMTTRPRRGAARRHRPSVARRHPAGRIARRPRVGSLPVSEIRRIRSRRSRSCRRGRPGCPGGSGTRVALRRRMCRWRWREEGGA